MGMFKTLLVDRIETLSQMSGYDPEFLMEAWFQCLDDLSADGKTAAEAWDYFRAVALERDL